MQNKKITQSVLLPVPLECIQESGINLDGVIETMAVDGALIIRNASTENLVCNNDCDNCPLSDENCEKRSCKNRYNNSEVFDDD